MPNQGERHPFDDLLQAATPEGRVTDFLIRLSILAVLVFSAFRLLEPFLGIFVWAVVIAVALSPLHQWLTPRLGGRAPLAAGLVTAAAFLVVIGPIAALASNLVVTLGEQVTAFNQGRLRIPRPKDTIADIPLIGPQLHDMWYLASTNIEDFLRSIAPTLLPAGETVLGILARVGLDLMGFLAAVLLAGFLFVPGHRLAEASKRLAGRVIEPRGAQFVDMAGATIRNVSRGVVGVAAIQMILAGIVMQVAGVPAAGLAAFLILALGIMQIGAMPVIAVVLIWAWFALPVGWAIFLMVTLIPIGLIDNILKPLLMSRGLATPTLVIFLGVLGGTISYGLIGLFLGPIVLSVFYDLLLAWTGHGEPAAVEPPQEG
ncbi:AI-2E family transporter [Tabrizicola sp. J26]|uniref:AI-2E family transporter n=1 Tax=Alitabrizicola rongguiensis TaxID=2909234 RepID=UPI001F3089D2|nr:AI-2E family transporter [Tabrizicola rongguiensis]MCF1707668.1 AI-2E family transporter [Tabrizicola rongguiensis]